MDILLNLSNSDAELAILASILVDSKLIITCLNSKLQIYDFSNKTYQVIYKTMLDLYKNNLDVDLTTVVSELRKNDVEVKMSILVSYIQYAVPSNIESYIKIVKELAYKRHISEKLIDIVNNIKDTDSTLIKGQIESVNRVVDNVDNITSLFTDASLIKKEQIQDGLQTGFSKLDQCLEGLVYGSLTVLTGEPSSGKSTLLNQIIAHNIADNQRAFIYSGELIEYNVLHWFMRSVANVEHIKQFKGRNGYYYDVDSQGEHLIREWIKNKLYIYKQDSMPSIDNLMNSIEYLALTKNVRLVILDNMMTVDNGGVEELEKQKTLARRLKNIAQKHKLCVILVAHPKKKEQGKLKTKYHMHDVSGASEVVNLCDYQLLLTRNIKETSSGREDNTYITILKNRTTGIQGINSQLYFDATRKRFYMNKQELNRDYGYCADNQERFRDVSIADIEEDVPF